MLAIQEIPIIDRTVDYVKETLANDSSGHDWWHIHRVWQMAKRIQADYKQVDTLVVELTALLHDIADHKNHNGDFEIGPVTARRFLENIAEISESQINHICNNIKNISFKGNTSKKNQLSLEGQIVQDADRLDAMGTIGIARTFAFGGSKGRKIYNPDLGCKSTQNKKNGYLSNYGDATSIDHFYEKLLLVKDLMNTPFAKKLAQKRHEFLIDFLSHFYDEWDGKI